MDYYKTTYDEINELIKENDLIKARMKLEEELSLPYIPSDYEEKFKEQLKIVYAALNEKEGTKRFYDEEELVSMLFSDSLEDELVMISYLKDMKLQPFLGHIERYLLDPKFEDIQSLLIYELIEAGIKDEVTTYKDGLEIKFIPMYCDLPEESDGFQMSLSYLEKNIQKNPGALQLALQVLHLMVMHKLPFVYEEDEVVLLSNSIIKYVYEALGLEDDYKILKNELKIDDEKLIKIPL